MNARDRYLVTALVSTYNAERFMPGLLDDLLQQTIADRVEIIVCDSASPQAERDIVAAYMERHQNIHYLRTGERENSHVSYNRCIQLGQGKYVTTANTDDRHNPRALEVMVRALEENPNVGLVYADSLITQRENETFAENTASTRYRWPDYTLAMALSTCPFGSAPLWRRAVHDKVGLFDPDLWIAGDQDMFLRIAWQSGAIHIPEPLGLFLQRPDSNSGTDNRREVTEDVLRVMKRFRREIPLTDVYPDLAHSDDREARAAALFDMGNLCALSPYNDYGMALKFYDEANEQKKGSGGLTEPDMARYANNAACIFACMGMVPKAREILDRAPESSESMINRQHLARMEESDGPVFPRDFAFAESDHPVVRSARRTRSLSETDGRLCWSEGRELAPWDVYDLIQAEPQSGDVLQAEQV